MRAIATLTVLSALSAACSQDDTFIVPAGFEGPVAVVFGDPTGVSSSNHTFRVASDGMLRVREDLGKNATLHFFEEGGTRGRIPLPAASGAVRGYFGYDTIVEAGCGPSGTPFRQFVSAAFFVGVLTRDVDWQRKIEAHLHDAQLESLRHQGRVEDIKCLEVGHRTEGSH